MRDVGVLRVVKPKVLFVCVHNSARSQMAEAFLKRLAGNDFDVFSAGLEPGVLNRDVVTVMAEIGYDISKARVKSVSDSEITSLAFRYVITVCAESDARACPIFPTLGQREQWYFGDPSTVEGNDAVRLGVIRHIRDRIKSRVEKWVADRHAEALAEAR